MAHRSYYLTRTPFNKGKRPGALSIRVRVQKKAPHAELNKIVSPAYCDLPIVAGGAALCRRLRAILETKTSFQIPSIG
jgi:hypothetical protein